MIIIDLQQVMISNFMVSIGNHTNINVDEDLLRHMVLNSIKRYNRLFKNEYGEMVIACDDRKQWRKNVFPYYKANRKVHREKSEIDWNVVFNVLNKIKDELREYFPYRVIQVPNAEADDVIGTIASHFGDTPTKMMIVSGDKDFKQLQTYMNVKQYDPVRDRYFVENNPERYLHEHIMKGDMGDGVPNFLSKDDCLVVKSRQKSVRQAKLDVWLDLKPEEFCDETMLRGYKRNQQLIDLSFIPEEIRTEVIAQFESQVGKRRDKLFDYFIEHNLKLLITDIGAF